MPVGGVTAELETGDSMRVAEFLAGLTPAQRSVLEAEAVQSAPLFLREGVLRTATSNTPAARNAYQAAILRQHVLRLLKQPGA